MKPSLLLGALLAATLLTSCGQPAANSNSSIVPAANSNVATGAIMTGATMPPAHVLLADIATAMQVAPMVMEPVSIAWPVGEGDYQYSIPASGVQFTVTRSAPTDTLFAAVQSATGMEDSKLLSSSALTQTMGLSRFPEVCHWVEPTPEQQQQRGTFTLTVACGTLDEARITRSAKTLPETERLFIELEDRISPMHTPPRDAYMSWHDTTTYEKETLVKAREVFFPKVEPSAEAKVGQDVFVELGFIRTNYVADGTVTGAQGYQRGDLGCIVVSSVRGWKQEMRQPSDVATNEESVPFFEKQPDGTSEMTVTCGIVTAS